MVYFQPLFDFWIIVFREFSKYLIKCTLHKKLVILEKVTFYYPEKVETALKKSIKPK